MIFIKVRKVLFIIALTLIISLLLVGLVSLIALALIVIPASRRLSVELFVKRLILSLVLLVIWILLIGLLWRLFLKPALFLILGVILRLIVW